MKSTGIVRNLDELGRFVVPKELRRMMGVKEGDPMEVFVDGDKVILKSYKPGCFICGEYEENLQQIENKKICKKCSSRVAGLHVSAGGSL
jgi:AbrB family transcriptional regulator, transcriptional pleiotropic regulator of transition state genes